MRLLKSILHACLWAGAASGALAAGSAEDLQRLRTRSLAATCAQCHGTDGRAVGRVDRAGAGRAVGSRHGRSR